MAKKLRGTSNYCPFVASDENTEPKVTGLNPFKLIFAKNNASRLAHKHVVHKDVVDGSIMIRFPLVIADSE